MFVPSEDDRAGSARTAAIDLQPLPTTAGLETWATALRQPSPRAGLARLMRTTVSSIREVRVGSARVAAQVKK